MSAPRRRARTRPPRPHWDTVTAFDAPPEPIDPLQWRADDYRGGTAFKGAAAELLACAHLMRQGFYVYRCESPSAPFDLIAYCDGIATRVEVKTVSWPHRVSTRDGAPSVSWPVNDEWDLLVVVDHERPACIEITTHDRRRGTDQVRAAYGREPAPIRTARYARDT